MQVATALAVIFAPLMEAIHLGSKLWKLSAVPAAPMKSLSVGAEIGRRDPREAVWRARSYVSVFSITPGSICRVSGYASHLQTQQEAQAPNRVRPGCCARGDA